ncbi:MAG: polyprenyl synthetase family protein [Leptolinea sp.]|jgi:geranylgeranyl pyrophosphate synthase|nr:polyprenyl synthetase family protein [Leptolinea sp.]
MDSSELINIKSVFSEVKPDLLVMEELIRRQVKNFHTDLAIALDLLLSAGGKRIRPTIIILLGKCLNTDYDRLITLAASIELLHTATLVHDDLIDGSILRRGSPTLNSKWSAGATVLTGDFLFAAAAKLASETKSNEVMKLFSDTLSTIVNGEISQMFSPRCKPGIDEYYKRIYAKTASLFETSATATGIISEAGQDIIQSLSLFGREIGMAFQIADDILDFTGDESILGKPIGSDLRQGLITLPTELFFEANPDHVLVKKILTDGCLTDPSDISQLIEDIHHNSVIEKSYEMAESFINRGIRALTPLPDCREKEMLQSLALSQARRIQ